MIKTMQPTILIIDDDPDDIELASMAVETSGQPVKVKPVTDGQTAMDYLRECADLPALILLDLKMPGMNGIDVLKEIRSDDRLKHIPVIIVTSSSLESDRKEALDAGADGFMLKSFAIAEFSRDIDSVLKRWLNH